MLSRRVGECGRSISMVLSYVVRVSPVDPRREPSAAAGAGSAISSVMR
jgi:hypothetical protein